MIAQDVGVTRDLSGGESSREADIDALKLGINVVVRGSLVVRDVAGEQSLQPFKCNVHSFVPIPAWFICDFRLFYRLDRM